MIAQLAKDLETCEPAGEIFVKSGKEHWIACKKSDLREVFVIVCQKNANLILIDGNSMFFILFKLVSAFLDKLTSLKQEKIKANLLNKFNKTKIYLITYVYH